jgi:hypothetical protein
MMGGYGGMMMSMMMGGTQWARHEVLDKEPLLNSLLNAHTTETIRRRAAYLALGLSQLSAGQVPTLMVVATEPFPCRLTSQDLVELLKMPARFGPARRVVLDHLGNRYGRRFVNHWAFVRFATEQKLGLDFTTPPKRPDPKESIERMLKILDQAEAEAKP